MKPSGWPASRAAVGVGQLARLGGRVDRREEPREERHRHDDEDQEGGDQEQRLPAQVPPGLAPEAQRGVVLLDLVGRLQGRLGKVGDEVLDVAVRGRRRPARAVL